MTIGMYSGTDFESIFIEKGWYTTKSEQLFKNNIIINGPFNIPEDVCGTVILISVLVGNEWITFGRKNIKRLIENSRKLTDDEVLIMDIIT